MSSEKNSVYTLIERRQSDRNYDASYSIPLDTLRRIAEAGCLAPSACNAQPWRFILVTEDEVKDEVAKALGRMNRFCSSASAFIVILQASVNLTSKLGTMIKGTNFAPYDVGIATAYMSLAATEEGLGSCIIGWLDKQRIRKILNVPDSMDIPLVLALGKSLDKLRTKKRKPTSSMIFEHKYD